MNGASITSLPLSPEEAREFVTVPESGGVSVFIGTVRNKNQGKSVKGLHYQAYDSMVLKEMEKATLEARDKWDLKKVFVAHRKGDLLIGDIAIIVACSSVHRKEAIEASTWLVDKLKATLPIWKREIYEDGSEWLNPNP